MCETFLKILVNQNLNVKKRKAEKCKEEHARKQKPEYASHIFTEAAPRHCPKTESRNCRHNELGGKGHEAGGSGIDKKLDEELVILEADAIINPRAVVIHAQRA